MVPSSAYLCVLAWFVFFLLPSVIVCAKNREDRECNTIGNLIKNKGFTYPWWDTSNRESSSGCPAAVGKSTKCCRDFESPLLKRDVEKAFGERWLASKLGAAAEIFKERKSKFDVTFKALLTRAHASFHAMFERTYGMLYIQHAHVFHALFSTLESYYDTGRDSLESKLNEFFAILTRKMFEVLNAQYDFDDAYLSCATIVISEKQGSELHRQIVSSLRRSFVATRALAQGLQDGDKILTSLQKVQVGPDCIIPLSQMLHCPICAEQRAYKPCLSLCVSISSKCLSTTVSMGKPWTEFTNALEGIIDRLLGPYNVEAVVEPIHIKISEAIMNFQESGPELSQAVFSKCGKPKLKSARGYSKRDTRAVEGPNPRAAERKVSPSNWDTRDFDSESKTSTQTDTAEGDLQPSKSLEKLLRETKSRVKKIKTLWEVLPRQVCNSISKDYSSQLCWNGTNALKPDRNKTTEENDVKTVIGKGTPNALVADQVLVLQSITDKLRASYNGLDVQWVQVIDELEIGSGMGSGSGDIPTDLEDSDDDDPNGQIRPKKKPSIPTAQNPTYPKYPSGPPPPIFRPLPNEDDDRDTDRDSSNNFNINTNSNRRPGSSSGSSNNKGGIDFGVFVPPKEKGYPPFEPPTTTTTTRKPDDVSKTVTPVTADGAGRTIAVFKLFTPIVVSMIGKIFSFS